MSWDGLTPNTFWYDEHRLLFNKDSRSMSDLPDEFVQMVCCSPPYWGLRKYAGLPDLIWGGNEKCEHRWDNFVRQGQSGGKSYKQDTQPASWFSPSKQNFCSLCGAWKGQLGLEPTPEMYVQHTVEILREIRRVLRKDGCVFWNCGDSYFGGGNNRGNKSPISDKQASNFGAVGQCAEHQKNIGKHPVLKPKDLCLIPFRVAIAAQEDGWYIRSVIIWNKPNPMPESVRDRPTESHEYILMLTKSARYYWDAEAVREQYTEPLNRWGGDEIRNSSHKYIELGGHDGEQHYGATSMFRKGRLVRPIETGRNLRSVWTFPTKGYPKAHFATFPEKLVEICVKAATPEVGCCSKCGKPWVRITERFTENTRPGKATGTAKSGTSEDPNQVLHQSDLSKYRQQIGFNTLGWQPACKCGADKIPSIVLDPFAGSGTTLKVAAKLNRRAIGYELSSDYCKLAVERNKQEVLL